ncbi:DUF2867 domain-containing protein [Streptomyces lavendulae]|uniref:DUF2867 domain-containing protein n=1 Tax=Streptomyces lavendulae TaxID=1914 RepID=UPI0024A0633A|nr:DUF2867 domain-containing protein [Streptomyces lavendulae]GLV97702.1 hypothetical protein Slala05_13340 [Streptomyces lavendulae subsp. lavendulae]
MVQAAGASLVSYDHVDAVAVDLPPGTNAEGFTRLLLSSPPRWTGRLMAVRDRLVAPFGLRVRERTAAQVTRIEPGVRKGPFTVLEVREDEILCGDDDKHLSFRASFAVRPGPDGSGPEGVCTTVVRFNRPVGRLYFRLIEPFHHLVIAALLARAAS